MHRQRPTPRLTAPQNRPLLTVSVRTPPALTTVQEARPLLYLKYMRDLAEQEAINRFTTAEVKIDMTGMTNRIDSDMDLDGVLNTLTEGFAEALEVAAEGVHE